MLPHHERSLWDKERSGFSVGEVQPGEGGCPRPPVELEELNLIHKVISRSGGVQTDVPPAGYSPSGSVSFLSEQLTARLRPSSGLVDGPLPTPADRDERIGVPSFTAVAWTGSG